MEIYMRCNNRHNFSPPVTFIIFLIAGNVFAQNEHLAKPAGRISQTSDAKIYYEVYGEGPGVVLLHGGLFGSIKEFQDLIGVLSQRHKVIAIATRGHGGSEVGKKPLSHELFADDFASIIKEVSKDPVVVIGFSDGGITAYQLAIKYPNLVTKLITIGAPLGLYGYTERGLKSLEEYDSPEELEKLAPKFVRAKKMEMPDSTTWNTFIHGMVAMWKQKEYISSEKMRLIKCPTLLIVGDNDEYTKTSHAIEIRDHIKSSFLAVIPGSGHTVLNSQSEITIKIITFFLDK
jgi:pimeloyl-ACP methyl ester carboxylesterase